MSVAKSYLVHGVKFPSGDFISELTNANLAVNSDDLTGIPSGHPVPLFTGSRGQRPDLTFTTHQLKTILDGMGLNGVDLSAGNTELFCKLDKDLGVRNANASTVHAVYRMAGAWGYWQSISARQGQEAEINCRVVPTWDGATLPLIPVGSVALSGTEAASQYYTLGPIKVNGTFLDSLQDWTLDLAYQCKEHAGDGDLYTTLAGLKEMVPAVRIAGMNVDQWATYGVLGTAVTSLSLFLRKKAANGGTVPDGTSEHIKLTATGGLMRGDSVSGAGNDPVNSGTLIRLRAPDASTAIITIDTAAAIS